MITVNLSYSSLFKDCYVKLQMTNFVLVGEEGPVAQALFELILDDMKHGPPSVRTSVPY